MVYIKGLNNFNQSDLETVSKEIKEVFGFKCEIIDPVKTTSELYSDNTRKLDKEKCASVLRPSNKTIYITNEYFDDENISGISMKNGKLIIASNTCNHLKKTIFHELGHTFGMDHCNNDKCIMATRNIMTCNGEFCDNCKIKLGLK